MNISLAIRGQGKARVCLALLALVVGGPAGAQTAESAVQTIRARYAVIVRESPGYRCAERSLEGRSTEGGTLRACFSGKTLRTLTATYYGETGRATEQYFYWEGRTLFFVFRRTEQYTKPLSGVVARTAEDRYYFQGDKLVRWLVGPRAMVTSTPSARTEQQRVLGNARELGRLAVAP